MGRKRHRLQLHERTRHHVRRQLRPQVIPQPLHIRLLAPVFVISGFCFMARRAGHCPCLFGSCRPVRHQPFVSRLVFPGQHHGIPHLRQLRQSCLDLSQLYSQPSDLDLEVVPAQILDLTISPPFAEISRSVHPGIRIITERVVHEALCR